MIWKSNELIQKQVISSVGNIASQFLNKSTFTQTLSHPNCFLRNLVLSTWSKNVRAYLHLKLNSHLTNLIFSCDNVQSVANT